MPRKTLFDQPEADDPHLPGSIGRLSERDRIEEARKWFSERVQAQRKAMNQPPDSRNQSTRPRRAELFLPYLLVRSKPGDRGGRALNLQPQEIGQSPDIWIVPGDPATNPAIPATTKTVDALARRAPHTLYAHVWNLGRAPIVGVRVEFYFELGLDTKGPPKVGPVGVARVDLPPRSSLACHTLVKCPKAISADGIIAFQAIVRVSAVGDPIGANPWNPVLNRHVARRIVVATPRLVDPRL